MCPCTKHCPVNLFKPAGRELNKTINALFGTDEFAALNLAIDLVAAQAKFTRLGKGEIPGLIFGNLVKLNFCLGFH